MGAINPPSPILFGTSATNLLTNLSSNFITPNQTVTASSGSTITLTNASTEQQVITGSVAQLITLPVASTMLQLGQGFYFLNTSTATATVQSSGANAVILIPTGQAAMVTTALLSGTTAASWYSVLVGPVGVINTVNIPNVTDPVAYTPTIVGFGTPTNVSFVSWRNGSELFVIGQFTSGTSTATTAQIGLGFNGGSGNVTSVVPQSAVNGTLGSAVLGAAGTQGTSVIGANGNTYVNLGFWNGAQAGTTPANGSQIMSTGQSITLSFHVTISGWTSNTSLNVLGGGGYVQPTVSTVGATFHTGNFSANSSGNYTVPSNLAYLKVRMVGGGGGGGGSGTTTTGGAGGNGGTTTFGTSLLTATGGTGGPASQNSSFAAGGTATVSAPAIQVTALPGQNSGGAQAIGTTYSSNITGGIGGNSPFFSGAALFGNTTTGAASSVVPNTGSGGGGGFAAAALVVGGAGGAGGAGIEAIIPNPIAGSTYAFAVGSAGTAGTAGTNGFAGGAGSAGYIEVIEYYYNGAIGTATNVTGVVAVANGGTGVTSLPNFRYHSSSTTVSGSLATVVYSTQDWDSTSIYNSSTGVATIILGGKYQVNASIAMTGTFVLNSKLDIQVQQTGSRSQIAESATFAGGAVTQMNTNVGDIFYLAAGDTLKVQTSNSGTTPVIAATTTQNWLSVAYIGP